MTECVGIVIVSHSPLVAEGAAQMVREMVGDEVPLAHCGGNPDGGLGTSVEKIMAAIEAAVPATGSPGGPDSKSRDPISAAIEALSAF